MGLSAQQIIVHPSNVNVTTDDDFQLKYTFNGGVFNNMLLPNLKDFFIINGPNVTSTRRSINGKVQSSSSVSYVLKPKKAGNFKIPPAQIKGRGVKGQSAPVTVSVKQGKLTKEEKGFAIKGDTPPIFIKTIIDTNRVYWGQQLIVSYRLYTSERVTNYTIQEAPAFPGFWVQDITPKQANPGQVTLNGNVYKTRDLKRFALFPQKTGELEIDGIEANMIYQKVTQRRGFFNSFRSHQEDFRSDPISVLVVPLPETDLEGSFLGGVGQFSVSGSLDRRSCMVDEALKYTVRISGNGNIKLVNLPKHENSDSFEYYEPSVSERMGTSKKNISGTKTFEYVIVPRKEGRLEIPEQKLYYYNLAQEQYQELRLPRQIVQVSPSNQKPVVEEVKAEKTIAANYTGKLNKMPAMKKAFQSFGLLAAYGLPFVLLGLFGVWHKRREAELGDVVGYRKKQASKEALKRLATAKTLLGSSEDKPFYDEILKSLQKYLIDKLNMPAGDFSKQLIDETLEQENISETNRSEVQELIQQCEIALYAPSAITGGKEGVYDRAIEVINNIEGQIA